jgi:catechol 2,3-dioxygenase-like lactoylglutathione lyase family enzyme
MEFLRLVLQVPASNRRAVEHFYASTLALGPQVEDAHRIGRTALAFEPRSGEPFYHYAILLPGDRFQAAQRWAQARVELLSHNGEAVMHFANWDADSLYFHDPAGNIVELIAHHGKAENGRHGEFTPAEFAGIAEIGLVGDVQRITTDLAALELERFQGDQELTFLGEPTGTIIVSAAGRGWLPLGRPAEPHPVQVSVAGAPKGVVTSDGHTVRRRGR